MTAAGLAWAAEWLWECMGGHLERPALETEQGARTYRQLLDDAEQVAIRISERVGQGAILVLAPRAAPDTVVLLLGLWRRGLTVVLANAGAPSARVEELVEALPPAAVLRPRESGEPAAVDDIVTGDLAWRLERCDLPTGFPYGCPDPAYVIATSGSTGTPKLVLCRHSGLRHLTEALIERYGYTPESRVLQFAPASYDAMIADVVVPLAAGSTLVFGTLGEPPSPARICQLLVEEHVTHVTLPPTVLRHLTELQAPGCTIISAGESLDRPLAESLLDRCGRLINAYGPCEATVAATAFDVSSDTADSVPIGAPLSGVDVQLADVPELPVGMHPEAGMISIGGPTVAWGYVAGDQLEAPSTPGFSTDRFVTGDLAWRTEAGELVFAGRVDRQIKRWGHRVEPGAIERVLRSISGVTDCVVVAEAGRLHAFVVSNQPEGTLAAAARELLARHEQPTDWHIVDRLPALASDKIDVTALTTAAAAAAAAASAPPPTSIVDPRLAALWDKFIGGADQPDTDVFAVGGDSLAVVLLLAAVGEEFGVSVDIADFLRLPTLAALDAHVAS
jgi:nonribosomal peptide synthetase CepA